MVGGPVANIQVFTHILSFMFFLTPLFSYNQQAPPVIDLSAESCGYNDTADQLHSNPSRYRFPISRDKKTQLKGFEHPVESLTLPKIKSEHTMVRIEGNVLPLNSSISTAKRTATPIPQVLSPTMFSVLQDELSGLLAQELNGDTNELVDAISNLANQSHAVVEEAVPILLAEQPLGNTARERLTAVILSRLYKYQPDRFSLQPTATHSSGAIFSASSRTHIPVVTTETKTQRNVHNLHVETELGTFTSNSSKGIFHIFTTMAKGRLNAPVLTEVRPMDGDLFIHVNTQANQEIRQVWLYKASGWEDISNYWKKEMMVIHPTIPDRVLTVNDQKPNWIMKTSAAAKARRTKSPSPER
ncbi:hypothetical protein K438DRAFT_1773983 [Mycena galopus ATCC 62051]|nr:hypothetical protein K438DRAFT_1773983 [Mycena galopus ATCC 62051]